MFVGANKYLSHKLLIVTIGTIVAVISVMGYLVYSSNRLISHYTPTLDAAMEVKLETTMAHLWFEEIISGDPHATIEEVWSHLDRADWYASAMMEGGSKGNVVFLPLTDPGLRSSIQSVRKAIVQFREITTQRYELFSAAKPGSEIDQRFDELFKLVLLELDDIASKLRQRMMAQQTGFRRTSIGLIIGSLLIALLVAYKLLGYERQRSEYFERIRAANARIKKQGRQLDHQANFDQLTGLPNRTLLVDRLQQAEVHASRNEQFVVVMFIDLDKFKSVNDIQGRPSGDRLLMIAGKRIVECVRDDDTVSRLSGDEFVVILDNIQSSENAMDVANHVASKIVHSLNQPFLVYGNTIVLSASVGIAISPMDGTDAEELLRKADIAMYHAKESGKNTYKFNTDELNQAAALRYEIEHALRSALTNGDFVLHYQPQWELATNRLVGFEALIRWTHPEKGLLPPDYFIPVAESTGLIEEIDNWVFQAACEQHAAWKKQGLKPGRMAINISTSHMHQRRIFSEIADLLTDYGMLPAELELELTESCLMQNNQVTQRLLVQLKSLGVRLAIDDFGTGYSSMAYLRDFSIDVLKIDRSFLAAVGEDPVAEAILRNMIDLAHALDLEIVAEGIETRVQLDIATERLCEYAQGFKLGRPMSASDAEALMSARQRGNNIHLLRPSS